MLRNVWIVFFFCCSFLVNNVALAQDVNICKIPETISKTVEKAYAGYNIVRPEDLKESDLVMFREDHDNKCPGFIQIHFLGTDSPTYALLLRKQQKNKTNYKLIVVSRANKGNEWEIKELAENIDGASAIWEESPGEYEGVLDRKKINAKYPVILLVGYESWAIVFSWTGSEVVKVWISD